MGPISQLLHKIPHRGLRRVAGLALMLGFSLLLGKILETTLHENTLKGLLDSQNALIGQVSALTPLRLTEEYAGDVDAALNGRWTYNAPAPRPAPAVITQGKHDEPTECAGARLGRSIYSLCSAERAAAGMSASECLAAGSGPACDALIDCIGKPPPPLPPGCSAIGPLLGESSLIQQLQKGNVKLGEPVSIVQPPQSIHPVLIPLATISHGVTRIASGGFWTIVFTVIQLISGFVAFVLITTAMRSGDAGFGDGWMNYILGPISVVLLGSLVALVAQGILLGALFLFSWITALAAWAATATGIAGGCWWCTQKLTEKGLEDVITKRL